MRIPKSSAEAQTMKLRAQQQRQMTKDAPDCNPGVNIMDMVRADDMAAMAETFLGLQHPIQQGTGGELVPPSEFNAPGMVEAVRRPDYVALEASIERVGLADRCGAFSLGLDTAETIQAKDATEQMLAHQMAAAHKMALELLAKVLRQRDTTEMARLSNAAARLMDVYQKAIQALHKIRSGGQQVVTVQHVQVQDGGQAIVNGAVQSKDLIPGGL